MPRYASVCQIRVPIGKPLETYGMGKKAPIGKPTAKHLATELGIRKPRPGWEVILCADTYLVNHSGSFYVDRRAPGEFQGTRRRRKRRK